MQNTVVLNTMRTLFCQLLTFKQDFGDYTTYVFLNLDSEQDYDKYLMCTKHPNWQSAPIQIGDRGYLKIKEIEAGKDMWFNNGTGGYVAYKYSGIQFLDFVPEKKDFTCYMA